MLVGSFVLRSSSLLLSLVDLVLMEPLLAPFYSLAGHKADPLYGPHSGPAPRLKSDEKKFLILVVGFVSLSPDSCWLVLLLVCLVLS